MSQTEAPVQPDAASHVDTTRQADVAPHVFTIFGATGDLTTRKLLPALYHIMQDQDVAENCYVLGVARSNWSDERFRNEMRQALQGHGFSESELSTWCDERLTYQRVKADGKNDRAEFNTLKQRIEALEAEHDLPGNRVFYLALPPKAFGTTTESLGQAGLNQSAGWTRLVIEKPFGFDLESAEKLNERIHQYFDERQIYRIDHFLGKETVQNLLAFRFGNAIFESLWNRDRIDRVEITVAEELGVEERAGYYDEAGHLRDMIQNHLTQLFTLIAMEPPAKLEADTIRSEKVKVLQATRPIDPDDVVFGQYSAGTVEDEAVPGYRDEDDVPGDSDTETFVALPLYVDNWRWQGVPFYLRTGKRLPRKLTQIAVHFRCAPVLLFQEAVSASPDASCDVHPNVLLITLQPNEGFDLHFEVKAPGSAMKLETQQLHFRYEEAFGPMPEAYETLLLDVITGDQTLFVHSNEVQASWKLYSPLLEADIPLYPYSAGTWGPETTQKLLAEWTNGVQS